MSPLIRNLMFALVLAVIVWLGYMLFIRDSEELVTVADSQIRNEAVQNSSEFLLRLHQLEQVELTGEILRDARFRSLRNLKQNIVSEPAGRKNPFLPIEPAE